jgi:hypothetical protein
MSAIHDRISVVTKTKTIRCQQCAAEHLQGITRNSPREILYAESRGGSRCVIVRICEHLAVEETFDIENESQDLELASPS